MEYVFCIVSSCWLRFFLFCFFKSHNSVFFVDIYDDLVFTVIWSFLPGVAVCGDTAIGEVDDRLLSPDDRFCGDDEFICRIFIFDDYIRMKSKK